MLPKYSRFQDFKNPNVVPRFAKIYLGCEVVQHVPGLQREYQDYTMLRFHFRSKRTLIQIASKPPTFDFIFDPIISTHWSSILFDNHPFEQKQHESFDARTVQLSSKYLGKCVHDFPQLFKTKSVYSNPSLRVSYRSQNPENMKMLGLFLSHEQIEKW